MNIKQIKEKYTCLDYLGEPLKRTSRGWYLYRCPWREDSHPSLNVSPDGKVWHDQSNGKKGGIIELVQSCLNTKNLSSVCAAFDSSSFLLPKSFDIQKEKDMVCSTFASFSILPLQSRGLYAYLTQRKVNTSIARQFLKEAHYSFHERADGRYLYALAYANDECGYELRGAPYSGNPHGFKGCTAPKTITTHLTLPGAPVVVFEGFMDMLSFATLCGSIRHNYITLNSIVNAPAAIEKLREYSGRILLALDNDEAGRNTTRDILQHLPKAEDIRSRYLPSKDLNDYLIMSREPARDHSPQPI